MPTDEFVFEFIRDLPFILIRIFTIILLLMHILFSVIILRQTSNMSKIIEAQISPTIYLIALIHFMVSVAVFIWSLMFFFL